MASKLMQINVVDLRDEYAKILPQNVQKILNLASGQKEIAFKGGIAKVCLMAALIKKGRFNDEARWQLEQKINDIDLAVILPSGGKELKPKFLEIYQNISWALGQKNLALKPQDIDIIAHTDRIRAIGSILGSNDLTINEVAVIFAAGIWKIFYTTSAAEHLIKGLGVFVKPRSGILNNNRGRAFPSPLGLIRLLKFFSVGKVNKIYLPKWWLGFYLENYQDKVKAGELPQGAPLGFYSLILMENYLAGDFNAQKNALTALCDLGLVEISDQAAYIKEQKRILSGFNPDFEMKVLSLDDVFAKFVGIKIKRDAARKERIEKIISCDHQWQAADCNLCEKSKCVIEICSLCQKNKSTYPLPCNLRRQMGKLDAKDFYPYEAAES